MKVSTQQATDLAHQHMEAFVNECGCASVAEVAVVLQAMACMIGVGMCATVGRDESVRRLRRAVEFIESTQPLDPWAMEMVQ